MTCQEKRQVVLSKLAQLDIKYKIFEHDAVFTMEDIENNKNNNLPDGIVAKNLFLKEHNNEKYFLVVTTGEKHADIKMLRKFLGTKPLSFATEEQLCCVLGVETGAVSPLAIINDTQNIVSLIVDDTLKGKLLGIHPNENTSTIYMTYQDLEKYANSCSHSLINMQV